MYDIWLSVDAARCHPLKLLCYSICNLQVVENPRDQWPIGFRALQQVAVGDFSKYLHLYDAFPPTSKAVAPLFLLPNLETLHISFVIDYMVDQLG